MHMVMMLTWLFMFDADTPRCMTTTAGDPTLELEYPRAFVEALAPTLQSHEKRFRYVHLSGGMVERDQMRSLWVKSGVRKIKVRGGTGRHASCCACGDFQRDK